MKNSLPCLSALAAMLACAAATAQDATAGVSAEGPATAPVAAPGAATSTTGTSAGDRLLVQAINQFERHKSVTARMRHQASIGGEQLYGVGSYWQQGNGDSVRVRMELQIAGQDSSLLQVANRGYLWVDRR